MTTDTLEHFALNDNGFAFDASTGHTYTLNETGIAVLKMVMKGRSGAEIVENLTRDYLVERVRVERDLEDFFHSIADMGITKIS